MRVGTLSYLVPGQSIAERFASAAGAGLDALEFLAFPGTDLPAWARELASGAAASGLSICAVIPAQNLIEDAHLPWFEHFLEQAAALGAVVVLTPEYAGQNPPPGPPPLSPPPTEELAAVRRHLAHLAAHAGRVGARVAIEAINRYETRFARSLQEAMALAEAAGPQLGLTADFFHLNIEEADIGASLFRAGPRLLHVHLADSNRFLPGHGHLDFGAGFRALRRLGYEQALSFECGLPQGEPQALAAAVRFIRERWRAAGESDGNAQR